jgi:hypothetical protein
VGLFFVTTVHSKITNAAQRTTSASQNKTQTNAHKKTLSRSPRLFSDVKLAGADGYLRLAFVNSRDTPTSLSHLLVTFFRMTFASFMIVAFFIMLYFAAKGRSLG